MTTLTRFVLDHKRLVFGFWLLVTIGAFVMNMQSVQGSIFQMLSHGIVSAALFLCVGVVEHKLHSRDIESMSGLIVSMPRVSVMMQIGMAGMFLAPFGMLISKWAVLKAVVDASPMLSVFIAFGSAATLFFWVKWMGKLIEVVNPPPRVAKELEAGEAVALYGLTATTALACLLFPLISRYYIEPYITGLYGHSVSLGQGNVIIMIIMMALVLLFPVTFLNYGRGVRVTDAYLGGANVKSSTQFRTSADDVQEVTTGNYYLHNIFNEAKLAGWGVAGCAVMLAVTLAAAFFKL